MGEQEAETEGNKQRQLLEPVPEQHEGPGGIMSRSRLAAAQNLWEEKVLGSSLKSAD